jgi:hypothetical protein
MVVTLGAPFTECSQIYETAYAAASQLRASPNGRNYHFVNVKDMGATYSNYSGPAGPGGTSGLTNGGFESNPVNANGWITNNWSGTPVFIWATDANHSGTYSAKISGSNMTAANFTTQNNIPLGGNVTATFSGWKSMNSFSGTGVYFAIQEFDSSGVAIPSRYWESPYSTGTSGWVQDTRTWTTTANCASIMIRCIANGTGTAWFDDLSLTHN